MHVGWFQIMTTLPQTNIATSAWKHGLGPWMAEVSDESWIDTVQLSLVVWSAYSLRYAYVVGVSVIYWQAADPFAALSLASLIVGVELALVKSRS